MSNDETQHVYRARLDFLYQSIAVYATTLVLYLVVRSFAVTEAFPSLWQDPLLLLLSFITLASALALLYNVFMRRQLVVGETELRFVSKARERSILTSQVRTVQFGSRNRPKNRRGVRVVRIWLTSRRRPVRIRLSNFERSGDLLADLRRWAGSMGQQDRSRKRLRGVSGEDRPSTERR